MANSKNGKLIRTLEVSFKTEGDLIKFVEFIENPPPTSKFVRNLIDKYQKRGEESA